MQYTHFLWYLFTGIHYMTFLVIASPNHITIVLSANGFTCTFKEISLIDIGNMFLKSLDYTPTRSIDFS